MKNSSDRREFLKRALSHLLPGTHTPGSADGSDSSWESIGTLAEFPPQRVYSLPTQGVTIVSMYEGLSALPYSAADEIESLNSLIPIRLGNKGSEIQVQQKGLWVVQWPNWKCVSVVSAEPCEVDMNSEDKRSIFEQWRMNDRQHD